MPERQCVGCGCTDSTPCEHVSPGGIILPGTCHWVFTEDGQPVCSFCAERFPPAEIEGDWGPHERVISEEQNQRVEALIAEQAARSREEQLGPGQEDTDDDYYW